MGTLLNNQQAIKRVRFLVVNVPHPLRPVTLSFTLQFEQEAMVKRVGYTLIV
jgi:hypothetical protein